MKFGPVPNLFRVLANAAAASEGLMGLSAALGREQQINRLEKNLSLRIPIVHGEKETSIAKWQPNTCPRKYGY